MSPEEQAGRHPVATASAPADWPGRRGAGGESGSVVDSRCGEDSWRRNIVHLRAVLHHRHSARIAGKCGLIMRNWYNGPLLISAKQPNDGRLLASGSPRGPRFALATPPPTLTISPVDRDQQRTDKSSPCEGSAVVLAAGDGSDRNQAVGHCPKLLRDRLGLTVVQITQPPPDRGRAELDDEDGCRDHLAGSVLAPRVFAVHHDGSEHTERGPGEAAGPAQGVPALSGASARRGRSGQCRPESATDP